MAPKRQHDQVRSRNEAFVDRTATRIWKEEPSADNPYIAAEVFCHGYDFYELIRKRSFVDVFYLLFRGELPSKDEAEIFETLMISLINPGPRHPAVRAAMNVGVGKTNPLHILPIASSIIGGQHLGGAEIEATMRFFRKHQKRDPVEVVLQRKKEATQTMPEFPGFGRHCGGCDLHAKKIVDELMQLPGAGDALKWGDGLAQTLESDGVGWLPPGIAAAVFADLGFQPRAGGSLFQLLSAPGLLAHGLELANKPITAMPFVKDDNYVIER